MLTYGHIIGISPASPNPLSPGGQRQEPGGQAQRAPRRDSSAEEMRRTGEVKKKSKDELGKGKLATRNGSKWEVSPSFPFQLFEIFWF